jgi:putative transposase
LPPAVRGRHAKAAGEPEERLELLALASLKKALKRYGRAKAIATGGMRSYPAAIRERGNLDRREAGRWL